MDAKTIMLVVAVILWLLAAIPINQGYVNLGWLGLFFYGLSLVIK